MQNWLAERNLAAHGLLTEVERDLPAEARALSRLDEDTQLHFAALEVVQSPQLIEGHAEDGDLFAVLVFT